MTLTNLPAQVPGAATWRRAQVRHSFNVEARDDAIRRAYTLGYTARQIADQFGLTAVRVYQITGARREAP